MRRIVLILAVLLVAGTAGAVETVLTRESVLYSIESSGPQARVEVVRRAAGVHEMLVVPGTEDEALESDVRLAFDQQSGMLFVLWHRLGEDDSIVLASRDAAGVWSEPLVIASGPARHEGLETVLTRSGETTLLHAAWWTVDGAVSTPEYALVAFEAGAHVSTETANLEELAAIREAGDYEVEDTGSAEHPPLAMARAEDGVDVVFGAMLTTAVTRVHITPQLGTNARIWKPVGRTGGERLPGAKLVSNTADPVRAFISRGRVVLYTPGSQFRFVVFENGRWSPARMIQLDESFSSDALLHELRRTVDEQADADDDIVTH